MTSNNSIHQIINRLHQLGNLEIGRSPKHPTFPNAKLDQEIVEFLDTYSFLKKDQGYVDFLESYAGLLIYRDSDFFSLSIYGFDEDISLHLVNGEGELIDELGILVFADITLPLQEEDQSADNLIAIGFGFDSTLQKTWGVYRRIDQQPYEYYCSSFLEWLEKIATQKGRLLEES